MLKRIEGVYTALVTPFTEDGDVAYDTLKKLVHYQIKAKVSGLVPLGTTGEASSLTDEEKEQVTKTIIAESRKRVPIIVGTGTNNTYKTIEATKKAKQWGADAALIVTPYYNKPTNTGIYLHFKAISDAVDMPIVIYNIGGRTGKNIDLSTMKRLATLKNVIAVKEASGDIHQIADILNEIPHLTLMSGDDGMAFSSMCLGSKGVISVAANIIPQQMVEMVQLSAKGKVEKARKLHMKLLPFFKAEFIETNPIPIKSAMAMKGMIKEVYRLPMCALTAGNKEKLRTVMDDMGLL